MLDRRRALGAIAGLAHGQFDLAAFQLFVDVEKTRQRPGVLGFHGQQTALAAARSQAALPEPTLHVERGEDAVAALAREFEARNLLAIVAERRADLDVEIERALLARVAAAGRERLDE